MRCILTFLILLFSLTLFSQNIELKGGLGINSFFDFKESYGHYNSTYHSNYAQAVEIVIKDFDYLEIQLSLGIEKYSGSIVAGDGGLGGGWNTSAEMDKTLITFGLTPINLTFLKNLELNLGLKFSALINENTVGYFDNWQATSPSDTPGPTVWHYDLNEKNENYSSRFYAGLVGQLSYKIYINNKLSIRPYYSYYFGLTSEFEQFPKYTKSMRHYFGIGFEIKNLKKALNKV